MKVPWRSGDDSDPTADTEEVEVEKTVSYTEHDGVARFTDGSELKYTFDTMSRDEHAIILKNYTGAGEISLGLVGGSVSFSTEAFVTIPYANLKEFVTTERRDRELTYTVTEEKATDT